MKRVFCKAAVVLIVLFSLANCRFSGASAARPESSPAPDPTEEMNMVYKINKEWKEILTSEQYRVLRLSGTERAFTGKYNDHYKDGTYVCGACGTPLFSSKTKYNHGTGWPSFTAAVGEGTVQFHSDNSHGMVRTEVRCAACGSHLGHVFDDGPAPTLLHFCINSAALDFQPAQPDDHASARQAGSSDGQGASPGRGQDLMGGACTAPPSPGKAGSHFSSSGDRAASPQNKTAIAPFAAGCFWGVEHKFRKVQGVVSTRVGYSGGHVENPTYRQVCSDKTGHAESIEITFDPAVVSYDALLQLFFRFHDPTQVNRQGLDVGTQYRSVIFYHDEE